MKIIDISMEIREKMTVYPGDPEPKIRQVSKKPKASSNLSLLTLGTHTGTHVDAPSHVKNGAKGASELPFESLAGECRVLDLRKAKAEITENDLKRFGIMKGEIILLKTKKSGMDENEKFNRNFAHLTEGAAELLAKAEIRTLGIDTPSVKKFHSKSKVHEILLENKITVFENLDLRKAKEGSYLFVGLPLKVNADGAPARAILIEHKK